jgi:hypothetical protein
VSGKHTPDAVSRLIMEMLDTGIQYRDEEDEDRPFWPGAEYDPATAKITVVLPDGCVAVLRVESVTPPT